MSWSIATAAMTKRRLAASTPHVLPVTMNHIGILQDLPALHQDPFDRMLIAQAIEQRCPLVRPIPDCRYTGTPGSICSGVNVKA
jgi:PIN domain nuclease of toxin-antitoxin system